MITLSELLKLKGIKNSFGKKPKLDDSLSFSTDTRTIKDGESFIAIDGPSFKPMKFASQLNRAPVIVYRDAEENNKFAKANEGNSFFIAVEDDIRFLQTIANAIAEKFKARGGKLIAISGSNGKTTTKEMLFHILASSVGNVVCTQKNNNNHIGVPITLFQIKQQIKYCILELGSNHPGEIKTLCEIANPNYAISTNIGDTHLEFFGNRENVFKEEGYPFYHMKNNGEENKIFFLNRDDELLSTLPVDSFVKTYGSDSSNNCVLEVTHDKAVVNSIILENNKLTGEHNFFNLGIAFYIAQILTGNNPEQLKDFAKSFKPTSNRSEWLKIKNSCVFLDAYNANPSSMKAAILGFKQKCLSEGVSLENMAFVLGDMNELGDNGADFHKDLGSFCAQEGLINLIFVGKFSADYNSGCNGCGEEYPDAKSLKDDAKFDLFKSKRVFIKGSRSLQLESIVDIS